MKSILHVSSLAFATVMIGFAADSSHATVAKIFDSDLSSAEGEIVSLAEAMPADKYSFAPSSGEFTGVRTFAQQISHIASVNYEVSSAILGEKTPVEMGEHENGAASLQTKDAVVKYLKDSFALAHKAMQSLTIANLTEQVKSPFGEGQTTRASLATIPVWHSFDHYGQAVVYARMNGIIPPASKH